LRLYHFNVSEKAWEELPGGVNTINNTVYGVVTHFSTFGVFGQESGSEGSGFVGSGNAVNTGGSGPEERGATALIPLSRFTVTPLIVSTTLQQEEMQNIVFNVHNIGKQEQTIDLHAEGLDPLVKSLTKTLHLYTGEAASANLHLHASKDTPPHIYTGKIVFKGNLPTEETAHVIVSVTQKEQLFGVILRFLSSKEVLAGSTLEPVVDLENRLAPGKETLVRVKVLVQDFDGVTFVVSEEKAAVVSTTQSVPFKITLPEVMPPGVYLVVAQVEYQNAVFQNYDTFEIVKEKGYRSWPNFFLSVMPGAPLVLFIILVIAIVLFKKLRLEGKAVNEPLPTHLSSDAPQPPHSVGMGQWWLSLLVAFVLFGTYLASHQGGLTGFVVAPLDADNQTVEPEVSQEEIVDNSEGGMNIITGAAVVDAGASLNESNVSSFENITEGAVLDFQPMFYYTDASPSDFVENVNLSTPDGTLLFDGKMGKYLYTSSFNITNLTEISLSFLTKEDFTYDSLEFVTLTLLLYNLHGEVIQTQTFSYDNDEVVMYESATGLSVLSTLYVPEGEWKKMRIEASIVPGLGASSLALMFQPDSSLVSQVSRHVIIDGVMISGS
jgi:hypothetical protein